jgi:hypothetical protein
LATVNGAIDTLDGSIDNTCHLQLYQEQISEFRRELAEIRDSLLAMGLDDEDKLMEARAGLEKGIFECSLRVKQLLQATKRPATSSTMSDSSGIKLPKLDVPTFNGDILTWRTFWEQFQVSVHDRSHLTDAEKLVYLRQALKDGTAKQTIEGLSRSGEHYGEAIECLTMRFDRPRLIHQTHVRKIMETATLKDGNGKELRKFHDTMQQHIRALKAMGYESPGPFLTSLLELKLDTATTFEWQKHTQETKDVPGYQELLDFVNLRAQASETSMSDSSRKGTRSELKFHKPVNSLAADVRVSPCVICKVDKHPLYGADYRRFKNVSSCWPC